MITVNKDDDNADGSNVSSRTHKFSSNDNINRMRTYESSKNDGQEFDGNVFTLVNNDNADGSDQDMYL